MKVDYRERITKKDIQIIRRALREAAFMYDRPEAPDYTKKQLSEFNGLLKKLNGMKLQGLLIRGGIA